YSVFHNLGSLAAFPTRRSSDLPVLPRHRRPAAPRHHPALARRRGPGRPGDPRRPRPRSLPPRTPPGGPRGQAPRGPVRSHVDLLPEPTPPLRTARPQSAGDPQWQDPGGPRPAVSRPRIGRGDPRRGGGQVLPLPAGSHGGPIGPLDRPQSRRQPRPQAGATGEPPARPVPG